MTDRDSSAMRFRAMDSQEALPRRPGRRDGLPRSSAPSPGAGQRREEVARPFRRKRPRGGPGRPSFAPRSSTPILDLRLRSDGWWSWPETSSTRKAPRRYAAELRAMEARLGIRLELDDRPVASPVDARRLAEEIRNTRPDGLLLILFYNRSLEEADLLLRVADEARIPAILFIGLGVKHGPVDGYRRPASTSFSPSTTCWQSRAASG